MNYLLGNKVELILILMNGFILTHEKMFYEWFSENLEIFESPRAGKPVL